MTDADKIRKIIEMTKCSAEEAENALEACGGDLLDSVLLIERSAAADAPEGDEPEEAGGKRKNKTTYTFTKNEFYVSGKDVREGVHSAGGFILRIINALNNNFLDVHYKEKKLMSLPISVVLLLIFNCFWFFVPFMIIAMFFGWRYSPSGEHLSRHEKSAEDEADDVNNE